MESHTEKTSKQLWNNESQKLLDENKESDDSESDENDSKKDEEKVEEVEKKLDFEVKKGIKFF